MLSQIDKDSHKGSDSPITIPNTWSFGTPVLYNKPGLMVRDPAGWSFQFTIAWHLSLSLATWRSLSNTPASLVEGTLFYPWPYLELSLVPNAWLVSSMTLSQFFVEDFHVLPKWWVDFCYELFERTVLPPMIPKICTSNFMIGLCCIMQIMWWVSHCPHPLCLPSL